MILVLIIRKDHHFEQMIKDKWDERVVVIGLDVSKHDYCANISTSASKPNYLFGVTNASTSATNSTGTCSFPNNEEGISDTCTSPASAHPIEEHVLVDWASFTVIADLVEDGFAKAIADEERVYEAMGFKAVPREVVTPQHVRSM